MYLKATPALRQEDSQCKGLPGPGTAVTLLPAACLVFEDPGSSRTNCVSWCT